MCIRALVRVFVYGYYMKMAGCGRSVLICVASLVDYSTTARMFASGYLDNYGAHTHIHIYIYLCMHVCVMHVLLEYMRYASGIRNEPTRCRKAINKRAKDCHCGYISHT